MSDNQESEPTIYEEQPKPWFYYALQYVMFICLGLSCMTVFILLAGIITNLIWGIEITTEISPEMMNDRIYLDAFRLIQIFASVGGFIVSSFIFSLYVKESPVEYLGLKDKPTLMSMLLVIVLAIVLQPASSYLLTLCNNISLPEAWAETEAKWRLAQDASLKVQRAFMAHDSTGDFLFNIFFMALLPAVGEELFFRKLSLRILFDTTKNVHLSIALAAFLFALIHGQVFYMPSLFLFGILLGYLAYWSGTLWLPVLAHFTNNFFGVTINYLAAKYPEATIFQDDYNYPMWSIAFSILLSTIILFSLWKKRKWAEE